MRRFGRCECRPVTVVDIDDGPVPIDAPMLDGPTAESSQPAVAPLGLGPSPDDPRSMSLSTLHLAVLDDGRRLTLLDDRGWAVHAPPDIWRRTTVEEIEETTRMVVGPDEPCGRHSQTEMEAEHWADPRWCSSAAGRAYRRWAAESAAP